MSVNFKYYTLNILTVSALQLPVIYADICQLTLGRSTFSRMNSLILIVSKPTIHRDPTVISRGRHTGFCGASPDKIPAILPSGIISKCRSSVDFRHLLPDKVGNPCLSVFSELAGAEMPK